MASPNVVPVEKKCIVCGQGSHRLDWQSKDNPACDQHSPAEIQAALAKLKPSPPAPAQTKQLAQTTQSAQPPVRT